MRPFQMSCALIGVTLGIVASRALLNSKSRETENKWAQFHEVRILSRNFDGTNHFLFVSDPVNASVPVSKIEFDAIKDGDVCTLRTMVVRGATFYRFIEKTNEAADWKARRHE